MGANTENGSANRFLTYCKAVGVLVAAVSGVVGMVVSIVTANQEPTEHLAKQSYKVVQEMVKNLSRDLRKEHDLNEHQHALIGKDISAIRGEMKLVVRLLESVRYRWARQPARVLKDLQTKVKKAPAVRSGNKPKRPPIRVLPPISNVQQQAQAAASKGDL